MSGSDLEALAREAGLEPDWRDFAGHHKRVSPDTLRAALEKMGYPAANDAQVRESLAQARREGGGGASTFLTAEAGRHVVLPTGMAAPGPAVLHLESGARHDLSLVAGADGIALSAIMEPGYHRLETGGREITLAIAPARAIRVDDVTEGRRVWGIAAQIYGLPPSEGAAFGDFGALARFARAAGAIGADALAMSPTHALFAADPSRFSPYAPSTRLFHNVLYGDPSVIFGADAPVPEAVPLGDLIDWPEAGRAKMAALRASFEAFRRLPEGDLRSEFERFLLEGGLLLQEHAVFEALHGHFLAAEGAGGWQAWPQAYRDPMAPAVTEFARENAGEVTFHVFLQWLADRSLHAAQTAAQESGMAIGLIADLAVGMDGGGSHAWSRRDDVLGGLSIGAPPDLLGPKGQDWGLTTFSPRALHQHGFAPFLATMRAAMRNAGGMRIDHVMGLSRLWVIPEGAPAKDGVYLSYPLEDMLRLAALESHRNGAILIGEDLGTVPAGFREKLDAAGVFGMRVLWFERAEEGGFIPPERWSEHAAAMTTTHDLPTVAGWWRGSDIDWRDEAGQNRDAEHGDEQREEREADRERLWQACVDAGVAQGPCPPVDEAGPVVDACLRLVAATPSILAIAPAEDLLGEGEQPNLPGTIAEHPNWRRRLGADLDAPHARRRLAMLAEARPKPETRTR